MSKEATDSNKEDDKPIIGNYCVVVDTNSVATIQELASPESVFSEAKNFIGCQWLDHVRLSGETIPLEHGVLEFLVNDNGYADWNNAPEKVNQVATAFYNSLYNCDPLHYVLGNIVLCALRDDGEGCNFYGMAKELAERVARDINVILAPFVKKNIPKPAVVPDPVVKVESFESNEEFLKYLKGDSSIQPSYTEIVSPMKEPDAECPADPA